MIRPVIGIDIICANDNPLCNREDLNAPVHCFRRKDFKIAAAMVPVGNAAALVVPDIAVVNIVHHKVIYINNAFNRPVPVIMLGQKDTWTQET
jgi:hypothetical protein